MTRNDFEALLWAYLRRQLKSPDDALSGLGISHEQRVALTAGDRAEYLAAFDHVRGHVARHVWDVNA